MDVVRLRALGPAGLSLGLEGQYGMDAFRAWRAAVEEAVRSGFQDRTAAFIEFEEKRSLIVPTLTGEEPFRLSRKRGYVTWVAGCSRSFLDDLLTDYGFDVRATLITSVPWGDTGRVEALLDAFDVWLSTGQAGAIATAEELMLMAADEEMWWLNPSQPLNDVRRRLRRLAAERGTTLVEVRFDGVPAPDDGGR